MKIILILILLFTIALLPAITMEEFKDEMLKKDKLYHFCASFLSAEVGYVACRTNNMNIDDAKLTATLFSFSVGLGKEYYDTKKKPPTGWSWYDLLADVAGTGCALILINNTQN